MPKPAITRVPNLAITPVSTNKNNGLYAPKLTTAQIVAIPASALTPGGIVYNTDTNTFQVYASYITAAGVTTSAWLPLGIPVMTAAQGVFFEAVNTIPGQMYIRSDTNIVRVYIAAWRSITTA